MKNIFLDKRCGYFNASKFFWGWQHTGKTRMSNHAFKIVQILTIIII